MSDIVIFLILSALPCCFIFQFIFELVKRYFKNNDDDEENN